MPRGHKGEPRTPGSGRKKGTPNKRTQNLMEICAEEGIDPFRALCRSAKESERSLHELCQYVLPKRKALEHTFEPTPEELVDLVKQTLNADANK